MNYEDWEPLYEAIVKDFQYEPRSDDRVALRLDEVLGGRRVKEAQLDAMIRGRPATVLGNGPNLERELSSVLGTVIAADEATSVALHHGVLPHIITTDLDGHVEDQVEANRRGSIVLVLGHGDNLPAVEAWAPRFLGPVMAMTQGRPRGGLHNFGGFTDGDRGVFLADHFQASSIRLLGFDFENPSPKDAPAELKRRKLRWARRLLETLGRWPGV